MARVWGSAVDRSWQTLDQCRHARNWQPVDDTLTRPIKLINHLIDLPFAIFNLRLYYLIVQVIFGCFNVEDFFNKVNDLFFLLL